MSLLNALWASLTGQQQSGLGRRERNTIELIAKRFNKDADWQIGVVSALCAEPRGTRDYIFGTVSNATRQLELLNAVLRKHSECILFAQGEYLHQPPAALRHLSVER